MFQKVGKPWPSGTALAWHAGGAGFESPRGNILCNLSSPEETINRGPNTPIPTTRALIYEELKDPGVPPKVVSVIVGVESVSYRTDNQHAQELNSLQHYPWE